MRKILIGIGAAVVVLAAVGFAGTEWLRYRTEREIEATFAAMRASVGAASYGRAQFSPWTRTIRISDVAVQANRNGANSTRIGELVLAGVPLLPPKDRIAARQVELTRTEIAGTGAKTVRIEGITIDDLDVSRATDWQRLRAVVEAMGGPPTSVPPPKDVLPVIAQTLEGIRFGRLEMRGLAFREGAGGVDVASVRLDGLVDGRLAELAVLGVNSVALPDKVSFGRIALKKFDLAGLLRKSARLSAANRQPAPDEIAELFAALEAIEMDEVVIPDQRLRASNGVIHVVAAQLSWGQFVGIMPTTARYAVKAEMPLADELGDLAQSLRAAGRKSLLVGFDMTTTWTERTRTLLLSPATFELDTLFSVGLKLSIDNFSPDLMTNDRFKTPLAIASLEIGAVELSLYDSGGLDLVAADAAKKMAISTSAARTKLASDMKLNARMQPQQSPEFERLVDGFGRFLAGEGSTLTIKLTPKGRVNVMQTLELAKLDPISVLSQFTVEALVGGR